MRFGNIVRSENTNGINLSLELFSDSGNTINMYQCDIEKEIFCNEVVAVHLLIDDCMDILIDKPFKCVTTAERYANNYLNKLKSKI